MNPELKKFQNYKNVLDKTGCGFCLKQRDTNYNSSTHR